MVKKATTLLLIFASVGIGKAYSQTDLLKYGIDDNQHIPKGLNVGDKAPIIYETAVNGDKINTAELIGEQEVVVLFYRGEWCPVCNKYLSNLSDSLAMIESKAKVLVIGPEVIDKAKEVSEQQKEMFTIISDTKELYLKGFDVSFYVSDKYQKKIQTFLHTSIAENNDQDYARLPVPATFVIGKDGIIKYKHFDYDYKVRASAKEILRALEY